MVVRTSLLVGRVVGGLDGHLDVVRVRLAQTGAGDPDEPALAVQLGDRTGTRVEHRLVQATDELVGDRGQRTLVGHLTLDALGDQLVVGGHVVLEVAVLRVGSITPAGRHRAQRAHAPVGLELLAVDEDQVTGGLGTPGEQRAEHHRVRAGHQGLGDVAGILQAAVADHRHPGRTGGASGVVDRGDLRNADPGDHPGGADRARADTDLDAVDARLDQGLGTCVRGDVAADDVDALGALLLLEALDDVDLRAGVTVGGVDDDDVDTLLDQRHAPFPRVAEDTDAGADPEPALRILRGVGVLVGLHEVLQGDQPGEPTVGVDQRELLDLVLRQQAEGLVIGDPDVAGDQRHRGHHLGDLAARVGLEAHVPVGDDADELHVTLDDRHAGDAEVGADLVDVLERGVGGDGDRLVDHAGLGALDLVDHRRLVRHGQIAVQNADAALPGHRDGHPGLGDGVHRGTDQRNLELDVPGQPRRGVHLGGDHVGLIGLEQHVVERETEHPERAGNL
ncbi:hypothetical protein SDC9_82729 [bioreactor metagenome]|uniref:NAD-specific glutamate dehydrogenase n=1 Tax=bioreactor metagenome TaxID=1076179 RepID=A0A644ZE24_9ZZZZ